MIKLTIPSEPIAQGRPRFVSRGKFVSTYDSLKLRINTLN